MPGSPTDGPPPADAPAATDKVCSLDEAVAHVRAGDAVHVVTNHTRWTAAARHLVRHWWGRDPGFTLVMLSLSSLGTLFFRGGLVTKVVTGYSGDVFPSFSPNPHFSGAYLRGEVEVEHWSFLTFLQRLEAAATGLPAVTTGSLAGSSMAGNPGYAEVDSPFGRVGLLEAYAPDITLLHAPLADRQGNLAFQPPGLEGVWGALAATRGVVALVPPGQGTGPPGTRRGRDPSRGPPRRAVRPRPTRRPLRRGPGVLVRGPFGQPRRRLRPVDRRMGPRPGHPGGVCGPIG